MSNSSGKAAGSSCETESKVRNKDFDPRIGYSHGRSLIVFSLWHLCRAAFFTTGVPWPNSIKLFLLKLFGASIGRDVYIKPRVSIHLPWKLTVGEYTWIGEEVSIINLAPISIGSNCCISQRVMLCSGNHDFRDPAMKYRNERIAICDGAWIGACSFIAPGVTIETDCVVAAGSVVTKSTCSGTLVRGNPAVGYGVRWKSTKEESLPSGD